MGEIDQVLTDFFEQDGWSVRRVGGQPLWQTGFRGDNASLTCFAQFREDPPQFVFYSICPLNVPEEKRARVAEFLTRANYGLTIGNFEMDWDGGEIRYKTSMGVEGVQFSVPIVQQLVYVNVVMMDRYLPGIVKAIYGDVMPADVIAEIEC